jgi:acyl-coenzyme A synthetase/AMP-(fatty) acid ligase
MSFFLRDAIQKKVYSWDYLISELNSTKNYNSVCCSTEYFEVMKQIIISMITGRELILKEESIQIPKYILTRIAEVNTDNIVSFNIQTKADLLKLLSSTSENWKITLFTSGTTGEPKAITHSLDSITRMVRTGAKSKDNIWGYAYNPTHMSGLQVFLQALLNGNPIVRLFNLTAENVINEINDYKITHISATPTFFKLLIPFQYVFDSLTHITLGGEIADEITLNKVKAICPFASILNIYASTEAGSLFSGKMDIMNVPVELINKVKIENSELLIHKSILGYSENFHEEWYPSGDLVEVISEHPLMFKFISRKDDLINVGGYKISLIEVEKAVLSISGVKNARVFAKSNSVLGNIICCEIMSENNTLTELEIRSQLKTKLLEHKIPRLVKFVNELPLTRTGKLNRYNL